MTITVLIADDQPLMRAALRTCLDAEPDLTVVGEAGGRRGDASGWPGACRPDVVVMDVRMPIMDGIEATRQIVALPGGAPARVLVMTTFDIDEYIIDALRAGASGFLVKDSPAEDVVHAVRLIAGGAGAARPVRHQTAPGPAGQDPAPRTVRGPERRPSPRSPPVS